jgi:predicted GIY-YIG superfamily endonuclease
MDNNLHLKFLITQMSEYIYVLELENNKWYVGKSLNVPKRFQEHLEGKGSSWTKKHKPIRIIEFKLIVSQHDENNLTKDYMKKYGIQNVRGGSYTQIELSPEITDIIQKEFNGNADKCYKCQKYGHFANKCTEESEEELVWECSYCDREFTTKFGCIVHEKSCSTKTSTKKGGCYRCGRDGHYSSDCYASRHVKGYEL